MSKKTSEPNAAKPEKAPKPEKKKKPKTQKMSLDFNPVASAMFDIQRREAAGNVISGAAFILLGFIIIVVSIFKYKDNMSKITADAERYFAYAWLVIALAGLFIGIIGVSEILKSFISFDQLNEWAKNAESHASPLQAPIERKAAQMNQSQSTEPAPTEGMAEDGGNAKKHFAFLGKKEKPNPNANKTYEKYNPPKKQQEAPPRAKPLMEQKFDYGIDEYKKETFADKFLAENKEDVFAQYRKDLGLEEEKHEEAVKKPQFIRSANAVKPNTPAAANTPANNGGIPIPPQPDLSGGGLFAKLAAAQGIDTDDDDDGFFMGTSSSSVKPQAVRQQLNEMQEQVKQLREVQEQLQQVQHVQQSVEQVQQQVRQVQEVQEQIRQVQEVKDQVEDVRKQVEQVQHVQEQMNDVQEQVDYVRRQMEKVRKNTDPKTKPTLTKKEETSAAPVSAPSSKIKMPSILKKAPMNTVKPPEIPKQSPSMTVKPPEIPKQTPMNTVKPPEIPKQAPMNTVKPPQLPNPSAKPNMPIPPKQPTSAPMPPVSNGRPTGSFMPPPIVNRPSPNMPQYGAPMPQSGFGGGYPQQMRPMGYQPMAPVQNMYQPLPNLPGMQGGYPSGYQQGYGVTPFGFAGSFADPSSVSYNPAMPPYTVHPFRPAGQFAAPQQGAQEQSYNSAMPPYTVHPFKPAGQIAAPQQGIQEQSYNSAMPPYTVHPFKPASADLAAPQMGEGESYNSAMPPYTVHPFKPASADVAAPQMGEGESYNSAMPPYTVHPFKPANTEMAAPQMGEGESYNSAMPPYTVHPFRPTPPPKTSPPVTKRSGENSYNSAMPPYTVHPFKPASDSSEPTIAPQLSQPNDEKLGFDLSSNTSEIKPFAPSFEKKADDTLQETKAADNLSAKPAEAPAPAIEIKHEPPKPESSEKAQSAEPEQPKRTQRGFMRRSPLTQRSGDDKNVKKPPMTQRLGEYTFSLFEELSGAGSEKPSKTKRGEMKSANKPDADKNNQGGKEMAFNLKGASREPEKKMSFSEKFLNRNGKKVVESSRQGGDAQIVKGGTPAQRKFVDASEFDEWTCPGCGSVNQEYTGVCACGERKPRNKW